MKISNVITKVVTISAIVAGISIGPSNAWSSGNHIDGGDQGLSNVLGEPGRVEDIDRTIEVGLQDNFFDPEMILVQPGETIRFRLKNDGDFVHEFSIGTPETHASHQKEMEMMVEHGILEPDRINRMAMNMEMGDGLSMKHDDPNSKLLEPGESYELIWKFNESASLEFACNIPGHYESGMAGVFEFRKELAQLN